MSRFAGYVAQEGQINLAVLTRNAAGSPQDPATLPTYRVYGPNGLMSGGAGSGAKLDTGNVTAASNATPIVLTSAAHDVATGTPVTVASVGGNTAANGSWLATVIDGNTFSLQGSVGNGLYTSGGTWHVTGLYVIALNALGANGYQAGQTYSVIVTWVISGVTYEDVISFTVV